MLIYITRRMLLMIPTLIGITLVVFFTMALSPGGTGAALTSAEGNMRPQEREAMRKYLNKRYGLDKPLYQQYFRWVNNISPIGFEVNDDATYGRFGFKSPSFGESWSRHRPVSDVILEALPITLLLNIITTPLVFGIAIIVGIRAAQNRGKTFDVASGTTLVGLWSVPSMWFGVMAIGYLASKDYLQIFPTGGLHDTLASRMTFLPSFAGGQFSRGYLLDLLWHLALPIITFTYGGFAVLAKLMRSAMLENIYADFARTARAKGLSENIILYRHVLRNSILPLITVSASILPGMLGGSVVIESIFTLDGMGRLMIDAINTRDRDLVLSVTLIVALLSLVSLLIADIGYAIADPRVSYE